MVATDGQDLSVCGLKLIRLGGLMRKTKKIKRIILNTTQQRVFDYMADFGSITSIEAFTDLGESRLSARIYELKDKGVNIGDEFIEVKNRFGETRWVKRYYIA